MTPEARIKADIRAWLLSQGAYVFAPVQMGMGAATVDQLVCLNGKFIGIEAKVPGKYPTARQLSTLKAINDAGGFAFCATSLDDVKKVIQAKGWIL